MQLLPRLRLALARRPWLYWLFVVGCAALVWSTLASAQSRLAEQRQQWGTTRRVWVAAADIAVGEPIRTVEREYPIAMVAASAIVNQPVDAIATTAIAAGEVLVAGDIIRTDRQLPPDWVVFALGLDDTPAVHGGSAVAVFGSGQRWCDGIVIQVGDENVEVAVPPTCADAVSAQVAAGSIVLAGLGTR